MKRTRFSHSLLLGLVVVPGLVLLDPAPSPAQPRSLLLSVSKPGETRSGRFRPLEPADLIRFQPGLSLETTPFLTRQNLDVLFGDLDKNGEFDDAPTNIDAVFCPSGSRRPSAYDLVVSFAAATTRAPGGKTVLDGDLIRLTPGGGITIVAAEAVLSSVTGTRTIDVDAATMTSSGELVFSFADDEETTHPLLVQQNGGVKKLGDETILAWKPGTSQVRIVHTQSAVIGFVSQATRKTLSSVVDVIGLAPDPVNPGELLFTVASTAKGLAGAVFTTAGGGSYASMNGQTLTGAGEWGLKAAPQIDALATYDGRSDPLSLELEGERLVSPGQIKTRLTVHGGVPSGTVQLFVTHATRPAPTPFLLGPPLNGVLFGYVTPGDPLLAASVHAPELKVGLDTTGRGSVRLDLSGLPPGFSFAIQAVDLSAYMVSEPQVIDLVSG